MPTRNVDFFDLKGELELLLAPKTARFEAATHPALHPGRCARIVVDEAPVGYLGELHPQWQQKYDLPLSPVLFEIDLDVFTQIRPPHFMEIIFYCRKIPNHNNKAYWTWSIKER